MRRALVYTICCTSGSDNGGAVTSFGNSDHVLDSKVWNQEDPFFIPLRYHRHRLSYRIESPVLVDSLN